MITKCGDANPKGNIALNYKGGCGKELKVIDAYRCVGCGGRFHKECLIKHFELEKEHDWGRNEERKRLIGKIKQLLPDYFDGAFSYGEEGKELREDNLAKEMTSRFISILKKER